MQMFVDLLGAIFSPMKKTHLRVEVSFREKAGWFDYLRTPPNAP